MILRYHLTDGAQLPALAESVEVGDDGAVSGWRSVATGGVGWFAGHVAEGETRDLRALVTAVGADAPPVSPALPGSATETLELPGRDPVTVGTAGDGPWSSLASAARALLDRLTGFPSAAIGLDVPTRGVALLVHRGAVPTAVDLSAMTVRVTGWRGYYELVDDRTAPVHGPDRVEAAPGWSYELDLGPEPPADVTRHVVVTFAIVAGDRRVPVQVQHTPTMQAPQD